MSAAWPDPADGYLDVADLEVEIKSSWRPVNLDPVLEGEAADPPPSILQRSDGQAVLYAGKVHVLAGEPEAGKGWLVCRAVSDELNLDHHVLYVDLEDTAAAIVSRLRALGVSDDRILEFFHYVRPDGPLDIDPTALAPRATVVIIDSVTEALALFGLKLESNTDQATFLKMLASPLADAGAAVVLVDHVVKDKDRQGRWAIGGQHKLAGPPVTYILTPISPFGRGLAGRSKLTVSKDRPGYIRTAAANGKIVGEVRFESDAETGAMSVEIVPGVATENFRPTALMQRISQYVVEHNAQDEQPGRNEILASVPGNAAWKRRALELLIEGGYLGFDQGPRGSHLHSSLKPFSE